MKVGIVTDLGGFGLKGELIPQQYLLDSGIQSIASVPLEVGGRIIGAIIFVANKRRVIWTEDLVKQLRVLAEIFSNALERKRSTQALLAGVAELQKSEAILRDSENVCVWRWSPANAWGGSGV